MTKLTAPALALLDPQLAFGEHRSIFSEQARRMRPEAREIQKLNRDKNLLDHTIDVSAFDARE